jgi:2-polyprenyl-6-methoxyphenol hydroxylase-like FAD-dependent oxidoreductase
MHSCDVVILGGGIGGSGAATVLSRAGLSVTVVEPTTEFPDLVRGEWLAPWGVAHTKATGLYDVLVDAGGHHVRAHVSYDTLVDPVEAAASPLPFEGLVADVPGPLTIRHPVACQALADAAAAAGAEVHRGAEAIQLQPDRAVTFTVDGHEHEVSARMVIGADGRASPTRKAIGVTLEKEERAHFLGGILLDGLHFFGEDTVEYTATEGGLHTLSFPQGGGRARVYLSYEDTEKERFSGRDRVEHLLAALPMDCWPGSEGFLEAEVAGPAAGYRGVDSWCSHPHADGVVLLGDAAGHSDPIIGQGLSITSADVRGVTEALLGSDDWSLGIFDAYGAERHERMRRLRGPARTYAHAVAGHGWGRDPARRAALQAEPLTSMMLATLMMGPYAMPDDAYDDQAINDLLALPTA